MTWRSVERSKKAVVDFNELARDFSSDAARRFEDEWAPIPISEEGEGIFVRSEEGSLWLLPADTSGYEGILAPGPEVIRLWDKFYRQASGMSAKELFASSYELDAGASLSIASPAILVRQGSSYRVDSLGRLKGL